MSDKGMKLNIDREWLLRMAEAEDSGCTSVSGLACDLGLIKIGIGRPLIERFHIQQLIADHPDLEWTDTLPTVRGLYLVELGPKVHFLGRFPDENSERYKGKRFLGPFTNGVPKEEESA